MSVKESSFINLQKVTNANELTEFLKTAYSDLTVDILNYWLTNDVRKKLYHPYTISKRSGGDRNILAPYLHLKEIQRLLVKTLDETYQPRQATQGYIKQRDIKTNAQIHKGQHWILRVDLQDFFPTIHRGRVRGLLIKSPFNFSENLADMISKLCTYPTSAVHSSLPQGAPTSPILSNLVCRTLDRDLMQLAKKYRCYYSRYADDLVFSTDRRSFPTALAYMAEGKSQVGASLEKIITKQNFVINIEKTILRNQQSRQMVTGLVVNQKVNVPREKVKELRAILHSWDTKGLDVTSSLFFSKYYLKNRPSNLGPPNFILVIIGRLQHIGYIKGWTDPVYLGLAQKLSALYPDFKLPEPQNDSANQQPHKIILHTEGETDRTHIQSALKNFHEVDKFSSMDINFHSETRLKGDGDLLKACEHLSDAQQQNTHVFVFDRDNPGILNKVADAPNNYKDWGNNVFSLLLPVPENRVGAICIEHYYPDDVLKRETSENRRLYSRDEFDSETSIHKDGGCVVKNLKKTLIIDSDVFDFKSRKSIALSKNDFAKHIQNKVPPFDDVDFSSFELLFKELERINTLNDH